MAFTVLFGMGWLFCFDRNRWDQFLLHNSMGRYSLCNAFRNHTLQILQGFRSHKMSSRLDDMIVPFVQNNLVRVFLIQIPETKNKSIVDYRDFELKMIFSEYHITFQRDRYVFRTTHMI